MRTYHSIETLKARTATITAGVTKRSNFMVTSAARSLTNHNMIPSLFDFANIIIAMTAAAIFALFGLRKLVGP